MSGRVVVGVDGSEGGRHALRWAIEEARLRDARLSVVHVWSAQLPVSSIGSAISHGDVAEFEQAEKALLERDIEAATSGCTSGDSIELEFVGGYAPNVLLDRSRDADLLVVGSRGHGGFTGVLLGSVGQHCASHATCPVAVVHEGSPLPDRGDVVVGVDASAGAETALRFALDEAGRRQARLVIAHAWWVEHPSATADLLPFVSLDRGDFTTRSVQLMHDLFDRANEHAVCRPSEVEFLPIEDAPARGLIALAEQANLLVVGSRGRGGFAGLLLGSVSQQCLNHARTAVIVVPPEDSAAA